ncbi:sugar phosphate nucleotidyltransferase [Micromonospora sp. NPDC048947]|uniref:sugar phosphate nucleotidyltransferase n=1 Tax=Micromonospora sp. NPDC048947 TaxID=3154826 RepID=UPI0033F985BA
MKDLAHVRIVSAIDRSTSPPSHATRSRKPAEREDHRRRCSWFHPVLIRAYAAAAGCRLWSLTRAVPTQLTPVFHKPMIGCPLSTLIFAAVSEMLGAAAANG